MFLVKDLVLALVEMNRTQAPTIATATIVKTCCDTISQPYQSRPHDDSKKISTHHLSLPPTLHKGRPPAIPRHSPEITRYP